MQSQMQPSPSWNPSVLNISQIQALSIYFRQKFYWPGRENTPERILVAPSSSSLFPSWLIDPPQKLPVKKGVSHAYESSSWAEMVP